jgi:hypothetical protein
MPSTYEPIATTTLGSAQTTVTLSSIPATYTDLVLIVSAQGARNLYGGDLTMQLNSDTGSNYSITNLTGDGSSASSARSSSQTSLSLGGDIGANGTSIYTPTIIQLFNYCNTTTNKTVISRHNNATYRVVATVGLWRSTSAINAIALTGNGYNFNAGSTFTLYGIKAFA